MGKEKNIQNKAGQKKIFLASLIFYLSFLMLSPVKVTAKDILLVHTQSYFEKVKRMAESGGGFLSDDTPVNKDNFESVFAAGR